MMIDIDNIKEGELYHYKIVSRSKNGEEVVLAEGDGVSCIFVEKEPKPLEIRGNEKINSFYKEEMERR